MDPTDTTTETITGTAATQILTLPEAGEAMEATVEAGPGLTSTEGREVLKEELLAVEVEAATLELEVATGEEDEGEEELPGMNPTNTNLNVAVNKMNVIGSSTA